MIRERVTKAGQRENRGLLPATMAVVKEPIFARAGIEKAKQRNLPMRPGAFLGGQDDVRQVDGFGCITLISGRLPQINRSQNTHRSGLVFNAVRVKGAAPESLASDCVAT